MYPFLSSRAELCDVFAVTEEDCSNSPAGRNVQPVRRDEDEDDDDDEDDGGRGKWTESSTEKRLALWMQVL